MQHDFSIDTFYYQNFTSKSLVLFGKTIHFIKGFILFKKILRAHGKGPNSVLH